MSDIEAVRTVVLRYCRGIDRRDLELVRDCYHPDATDDHGRAFSGTRDEFVAWVARVLERYEGTMHTVSNQLVELGPGGDTAECESYGVAYHWGSPPDDPRVNFTTGFRYLDRFERRDGRWRIGARRVALEWVREGR